MPESLRQKKVSRLIKEELSRHIQKLLQDHCLLVTITRIHMTKDLKTAHVFLSFYGDKSPGIYLDILRAKSGFLRKSIASKIKLKYNPQLIFTQDPAFQDDDRVSEILEALKKNDKGHYKKDR